MTKPANQIVPFDKFTSAMMDYSDLGGASDLDALAGGISSGFAVVSVRGKVWRVKYQGTEEPLRDKDGEPIRKFNAIIVGVSPALSKTYYEGAYSPDADNPPDCTSIDGIKPDPSSPSVQSATCATCQWNQFGSKISADGSGKGKACQDYKRLAVVPAIDRNNTKYGGPMLLRIPPASLQNLISFMGQLKKFNCPPFACVTEISFDLEAEFPKLILRPAFAIVDRDVINDILSIRGEPVIESVLYGGAMTALASLPVGRLPAPAQPAKVTQPARKATNGTKPPVQEPVEEAETTDELLGGLDGAAEGDDGDDDGGASLDTLPQAQSATAAPKPRKRAAQPAKPAPAQTLSSAGEQGLGDLLDGLLNS